MTWVDYFDPTYVAICVGCFAKSEFRLGDSHCALSKVRAHLSGVIFKSCTARVKANHRPGGGVGGGVWLWCVVAGATVTATGRKPSAEPCW